MGIEWPFRHLIALRPRELPILLKREFMHRRILSPAVELLHHPTQTAAPEHAIASAAPAASSKSPLHTHSPGIGRTRTRIHFVGGAGSDVHPRPRSRRHAVGCLGG